MTFKPVKLACSTTALSMIHAAVCRAVLDGRPEYLQEFATPNSPRLTLDTDQY